MARESKLFDDYVPHIDVVPEQKNVVVWLCHGLIDMGFTLSYKAG
jgi:hypothetical protein